MKRINETDITSDYTPIHMGLQSKYQQGKIENQPTHYTMTLGDNGFDKVRYYRLNLDTR
jgi:hypothetical protein